MASSLGSRLLLLLGFTLLIGCGRSGLVPVSGVVTVNGEPRENVRVVFAPMASGENSNPGPFSVGVTDADGKYSLTTRDGDYGAVAGRHTVSFTYDDLEHLDDLKSWLSNAESKEDAAAAKAKIEHVQKEIARRGAIAKSSKQTVEVSGGGTDKADFEIGNQPNK